MGKGSRLATAFDYDHNGLRDRALGGEIQSPHDEGRKGCCLTRKVPPRTRSAPAKSPKLELSADTLTKLGAKKLAALLLAASEDDVVLARKLRMELMAHDPEALAREIDRQISILRRSRSFVDWNKTGELAKTLDGLLASIAGPLAAADPCLAAERFFNFFALGQPTIDRVDDSSGRVSSVFRSATEGFATTLAFISDPEAQFAFAKRGYEAAEADDYGLLDDLVADVTQRLSPASLAMMRTFVEANIEASPPVIEDGRLNHLASLHASALAAVADAQRDVDLYIRAQTLKGPRLRDDCGIAQRLLKEQRAPEALAHLDSIDATVSRDTYLLEDVRIEVMEALGRREATQALRWSAFERRLSQEHLRGYLKRLPEFDAEAKQDEAMSLAATRPLPSALEFFINWPNIRAAGALVRARSGELDGDWYFLYTPAAALLESREPLAATLLRRAMIDFTLGKGRSSRYEHASRHMAECASISPMIKDWSGAPDHTAYVAHLKAAHPRKTGFWLRVQGI